MVGLMGSPGGADDPVTATFKVLADPTVYAKKYDELLKQTLAAQEAAETARRERKQADERIAQAAKDADDVAKAQVALQNATDAAAFRELQVFDRERKAQSWEADLATREQALRASGITQAAQLASDRAAFEAAATAKANALDARAAAIAEMEFTNRKLNEEATALKADYERRLAQLLAIAGGT